MHARPSILLLVTVAAPTRRALPRRALTTTPCALLGCAGSVALSPSPGHVVSQRTAFANSPTKGPPQSRPSASRTSCSCGVRGKQDQRGATQPEGMYTYTQSARSCFGVTCKGFVTLTFAHGAAGRPRAIMAFLLLTRSPFGLPTASLDAHMDCGSVSLCGIMTLETGKGPGMHRPARRSHHTPTQPGSTPPR